MAAISESDIGKRVTIRLKGEDGYRDLVGHLISPTSLRNRHGEVKDFNPEQIHIWHIIDDVPRTATSGAPLSIRIYEIEEALNKTWSAKVQEYRSGWLYRADNGITRRANSALVLNQKNHIDDVIGWYRERDLTPTIHLIPTLHSQLDQELIGRGFKDSLDALVMVKEHDALSYIDSKKFKNSYKVSESPDIEWLTAQGDEQLAELMQRSNAKYLTLRHDAERVVAVGRIGFADDWAVLSRIWVAPNERGKGLGREIMYALERECIAPKLALQVAKSNSVAINLYETFGYQIHHEYRFRALPQRIDLIQDLCC
ncbi:MAG: GNAT family N-acetyltransferase [Candidatus Nanopelagicaceae bacterium]